MHYLLTVRVDVPGRSLDTIKIAVIHRFGQMGVIFRALPACQLRESQASTQEVSRQSRLCT